MIYEKLLNDKLGVNLGYLYENVVAQMLTAKGDQLFYYTSLNPSTRRNYNMDFNKFPALHTSAHFSTLSP